MKKLETLLVTCILTLLSLSAKAQTPNIIMTTSLPVGSKFEFSMVMAAGNDVWIDFGDGNKKYKAVVNTTTFTETLKGSTIKIYNTSSTNFISGIKCENMQLSSFDASNEPNLYWFELDNNQISSIDLSKNHKLNSLTINYNNLTSLTISDQPTLHMVHCYGNQLTAISFTNLASLDYFDCSKNKLKSIDMSGCPKLYSLSAEENELTSITLSNNPELTELYLMDNQLKSIDLSVVTKLEQLMLFNNQLSALNVSKNIEMKRLSCSGNLLTTIDVSKNTKLSSLDISKNNFTFATAPLPSASITGYDYSNQNPNPINIPKSHLPNQTVDLSKYKNGQGKASTYVWYDKAWNEIGSDYVTVTNGITTFKKAYADSIRCEINNEDFPKLSFRTSYTLIKPLATGVDENKAPIISITSSNQRLTISTDATGELAVCDLSGQLLLKAILTGKPLLIDDLKKGIYIIKISSGQQKIYSYKALVK